MDLEKVGVKKSLVRVDRPVLELTSVGQTTRARAQLEFERRFCVNTTKEVTGVDVKLTKRDQLATLLDMRRTLLTYFPDITRKLRYEMKALLEQEYVKYGKIAVAYKLPKEVD